jgi:NAD-dependent deacetylase
LANIGKVFLFLWFPIVENRITLDSMKKIVVLTGAGISAESGIQTFRDSDGLWHGYKVEEVATPQGFAKNPKLVLDFYNERRKNILAAQPNDAHKGLVALEKNYEVQIITQNIDDLHERAGSKNVMHLHGEILKMCSVNNKTKTYPIAGDIDVNDLDADGKQLRPFIVWFNEEVPMIEPAMQICRQADILVIIGTSFVVYPAASLVQFVTANTPVYIIDKKIPEIKLKENFYCIEKPATEGVKLLLEKLQLA